ncbi:DUF680 domain-containing protein [Mesorhizobium sp. M2D.F.Ca.ET.185.01.1.1]|uniref:DUF680 domain-containing protein n=1 Tax=unclassified Mesorhizobium TaxID=325217 RepID=UPI000FCB3F97|nr:MULTISPECIES: DUF680 domain-containing protein [unclassified Mesorhizobium]TGP57094.1 DUF680 domain-containing protein [bacterium M00.F.Ca.ET.230.01.1.1]TGP76440.1 DUF680 domain-containing protein [bacterium M00.F.Ca.ET.227.01.1.1]TGP92491.1 DUF680 domain-containing protein [bacterium M00.F.Ca.ET.222.01.1.1]TGP97046.1 DUF680 domain-containing protein [bacterium M00.F.Ca.ET.221.01.1.1]TGT68540.1 DUF680 domain-containing protein [bacterium M00.F.Ca.ET.159.01.1.1]TGT80374.1 DUF680 domain-cont
MNRTIFAAVAILIATGSAFAGSDHFVAAGQQAVAVDTTTTASIAQSEMARHDMKPAARIAADEPGQGIWGR